MVPLQWKMDVSSIGAGMWYFLVIFGLVALAVVIKKLSSKAPQSAQSPLEYQQVDSLITPAEQKFLSVLDDAVGARARIFCMVRVADILKPKKTLDQKDKRVLLNKTSQKHFDFVLCDPVSLRPLCVIELNDKSHQRKDRQDRDKFLASACESADLPLHFVKVSKQYQIPEIASLVDQHLPVLFKKAG